MNKSFGLGKGLGSLIPGQYNKTENYTEPIILPGEKVQLVAVEKIKPNPHQPRKDFAAIELASLTESIKEHGILQPLIVSPAAEGDYQLIAGERRLRAAKLAGLKTVPVIARQFKEQQKLELALIENLQRQDLNILEEADAYQKLIEQFNLSHEEVAKKVGKSRPVVSNALRLLKLPAKIKQDILSGKVLATHARIMAGLAGEELEKFYQQVVSQKLTVAQAEQAVKQVAVKKHFRSLAIDPELLANQEALRQALGTKVEIKKKGGTGQIILQFYSEEEYQKLLNELKRFIV
ncbi:MAG: ParB/RepB/Spo0J family partition protein [Candidatus Buchananbacteria bacterium]